MPIVVQRQQLVRGATGLRIREVAVELRGLESERAARSTACDTAGTALRSGKSIAGRRRCRAPRRPARRFASVCCAFHSYVKPPQLPSGWRMNRRVSIRRVPTRKFFISTVPFGKSQSLSAPTVIVVPFGSADPALLGRAVRPERRIDRIRDQAGRWLRRIARVRRSRSRSASRGPCRRRRRRLEVDPVQRAAG